MRFDFHSLPFIPFIQPAPFMQPPAAVSVQQPLVEEQDNFDRKKAEVKLRLASAVLQKDRVMQCKVTIVGNKAKGRISKRAFQERKAR